MLKKNLYKQIKHLNVFATKKSLEKLDKIYEKRIAAIKKFKILRGLILSGYASKEEKKIYKKMFGAFKKCDN